MSTHLQRFVDRLRGFEARGSKEFSMNINDAKDLHADITRLLIELNTLRETLHNVKEQEQSNNIEISGGKF